MDDLFPDAPGDASNAFGATRPPRAPREPREPDRWRQEPPRPAGYAGLGRRAAAAVIDVLVGFLIVAAAWLLVFGLTTDDPSVAEGVLLLLLLLATTAAPFLYRAAWVASPLGRPPGMRLLGLRLVRSDGRPLAAGTVAARDLLFLGGLPVLHWV